MRTRVGQIMIAVILMTAAAASLVVLTPDASAISQSADNDVNANPDAAGNPVVGDDRPGDIASASTANYAAWSLVAVCLILAGALLIKIERWEARRIPQPDPGSR